MTSQLEELQKLNANAKTFKIPVKPAEGEVQAEIKLYPLAIDELQSFIKQEDSSDEENVNASIELIAKSMEIDIAAAKKIPVRYMDDLMNCIMEINNMTDKSDQGKKIQDFLKQKQDLAPVEETKNNEPIKSSGTTEE